MCGWRSTTGSNSALRTPYSPPDLTLLEIDTIEAVASSELIYHLAETLPPHQPGSPGRPPDFPPWVYVLHKALAGVLGSHSKATRAMAHLLALDPPSRRCTRRAEIDAVEAIEVRRVDLPERGDAVDSGVVHENIDLAFRKLCG